MVEGPTAKAYAIRIYNEMHNEVINDVFVRSRKVYVPIKELVGKNIKSTDTIGKNILMFIDGYVVRVHLMMFGAIHIYGINDPLLKPEKQVRMKMIGEKKKLVVYNAPIIEVDLSDRLLKRLKSKFGPDPLREDWSREDAINRILSAGNRKIGEVLLDQSIIAGIGNILRNEILFRAGIHPERMVNQLSRDEVEKIVKISEDLCKIFLEIKLRRERLKPILYVYNRYNKPCKICGNLIKFYIQKEVKRKTFVCEKCQK